MAFTDEQRLAFGAVAELYDRVRPAYPEDAVDELFADARLATGDRVLEVGAGTGKLTVELARRGLRIVALEPSEEMAALARANCRTWDTVQVIEAKFEHWSPAEPVAALVSANAWHWIAPELRYARAHAALAPRGTLASLWSLPDWSACRLRDALRAVYARAAPGLAPDFPMHPGSDPTRLAGDWPGEIAASPGFAGARLSLHPWTQPYSAAEYTDLLQTHQDHIHLPAGVRGRLMAAIAEAIDAAGGTLELPYITRLCLATRSREPVRKV